MIAPDRHLFSGRCRGVGVLRAHNDTDGRSEPVHEVTNFWYSLVTVVSSAWDVSSVTVMQARERKKVMETANGMGVRRSGRNRNYMDVGESGAAREIVMSNEPAGRSVQRKRSFERFGSVIAAGLLTAGLCGLPSIALAHRGDGIGNRDGVGGVVLCHIPPGNPENRHTITVSQSGAAVHHRHGDTLGYCDPSEEPLPPGAFADFTPNAILGQPFSYNIFWPTTSLAIRRERSQTSSALTPTAAANGCRSIWQRA